MNQEPQTIKPVNGVKEALQSIRLCPEGRGRRLVLNLDSMQFFCSNNDYARPSEYKYFWECRCHEAVIGLARSCVYANEGAMLLLALYRLQDDLRDNVRIRSRLVNENRQNELPRIDARMELLINAIASLKAAGAEQGKLPDLPDYNETELAEQGADAFLNVCR